MRILARVAGEFALLSQLIIDNSHEMDVPLLSFSRLTPLALILVVAACGGSTSNGTSPSSTIVPAATPTAKDWQTACLDAEILAAESLNYDVEVTVSAPGLSRKYDILVSGEDYHLTGHLTIGEGYDVPPFSGTVELMEVGGTIYSKEEEGSGQCWMRRLQP